MNHLTTHGSADCQLNYLDLWNLLCQADPLESTSLAEQMPDMFSELLAIIDAGQETVYSPDRGSKDPAACQAVINRSFYWGPWLL